MTVLEVGLGVALMLSVVYWAVDHLFKIIKIDELEQELEAEHECNPVNFERWKKCKDEAKLGINRRKEDENNR